MSASFNIWQLLAGVAIFILGMNLLEDALQLLAGRRFKLFLKKQTANRFAAILGGAIVTGILQSSSIVNLMVLAFVGTNVLTMQNALAVILGANLGSTLCNWVVATLGFQYNIEGFAFPITAIAGIALAFFNKESAWRQWSKFFLGFGFLFVGLDMMKSGMEGYVKQVDLNAFMHYPVIIFLIIGLAITSLVQSSSTTVALALSALYAHAITLYVAMAIVLGSEVGTTLKLMVASTGGIPAKKRVALGNFLFNIIGTVLFLVLLKQVEYLITDICSIKNNLIALVFFQSIVNLASIALFYPFLNIFGRFLEKKFRNEDNGTMFINKVITTDVDSATEALEKETRHFIYCIVDFSRSIFNIRNSQSGDYIQQSFLSKTTMDKYDYIKRLHGNIHSFYVTLQSTPSPADITQRLDQLISSVRNGMYAAKSMKDAYTDSEQLRNSSNDAKYNRYISTRAQLKDFFNSIDHVLGQTDRNLYFETIVGLYRDVQQGYTTALNDLYKKELFPLLTEVELSTIINFNREIHTALKALVFSLKDFLLTTKEAEYFDDLPGFIR